MESTFIEWVKTSIPGIILLGAIGSILAVTALKLLALIATRWVLPAKYSLVKLIYGFRNGPLLIIEHLKTSQEPRELTATIALLLSMQILLGSGVLAGALFTGLGLISHSQNTEVSQHLLFFGSFLIFISLAFSFKLSRHLFAIYIIHMSTAEAIVADVISKKIGPKKSNSKT